MTVETTPLIDATAIAPKARAEAPRRDNQPAPSDTKAEPNASQPRERSDASSANQSQRSESESSFKRQLEGTQSPQAQDEDDTAEAELAEATPTGVVDEKNSGLQLAGLLIPQATNQAPITLEVTLETLDQATPTLPPLLTAKDGPAVMASETAIEATAMAQNLGTGEPATPQLHITTGPAVAAQAAIGTPGATHIPNNNATDPKTTASTHLLASAESAEGAIDGDGDVNLTTGFTNTDVNGGSQGFDFNQQSQQSFANTDDEAVGLQGVSSQRGGAEIALNTVADNDSSSDAEAILPANPQRGAAMTQGQQSIGELKPTQASAQQVEVNASERAVANQITRAVINQIADGQRTLSIRLTPPELGTVRVQIIEQAGRIQVSMSAEDEGVRNALERALPNMRQELRAGDSQINDLRLIDEHFHSGHDQQHEHTHNQPNGRDSSNRNGSRPQFSIDGQQPAPEPQSSRPQLGGTVSQDQVDTRA